MATPFEITPATLVSMATTRPAPGDVRLLSAGVHSRRLVLLRGLLARAEGHSVPPAVRQRFEGHWRLLERAEARAPRAARRVLGYPSVGNWLVHALSATGGDGGDRATGGDRADGADRADFLDAFGALAAAVALRAGIAFRLTLPTQQGRLALPGVGVYDAGTARVRLVGGPHSLQVRDGGRSRTLLGPLGLPRAGAAPGWHGLRPLPGGTAMLDDLDPHRGGPWRTARAAPPLTDTGPGSRRTRDWQSRWSAALALLRSADQERRAEVTSLVRALVPLERSAPAGGPAGGAAAGTASATLRAAPWAVLTGLPGSAVQMASVLVHEVQHSKLAVLSDLVPLHAPGGGAVHRVGWRSDPRPVEAVLQGTYAHLALADLWYRLARRPGASPAARTAARRRVADYREQTDEALDSLLRSGELTSYGTEFTHAMRGHHRSLGRPSEGPAPDSNTRHHLVT